MRSHAPVFAAGLVLSGLLLGSCERSVRQTGLGPSSVPTAAPNPQPTPLPGPPPPGPPLGLVGRVAFDSNRDGVYRIYVANGDGSDVTPIAVGNGPAWSPDGQRIAFQRNGRVYVVNAGGSGEQEVVDGSSPAWSPDGRSILFTRDFGRVGDGLFVVNMDGSGARQLVTVEEIGFACACSPAWSPDGRLIAFVGADWDTGRRVYVMGDEAAKPVLLFYLDVDRLSFSRDGSELLFGHSGGGVAAVRPDGSGRRDLFVGQSFEPDWLPGGRGIVFHASAAGRLGNRIYVLVDGDQKVQFIPEAIDPRVRDYSDSSADWFP